MSNSLFRTLQNKFTTTPTVTSLEGLREEHRKWLISKESPFVVLKLFFSETLSCESRSEITYDEFLSKTPKPGFYVLQVWSNNQILFEQLACHTVAEVEDDLEGESEMPVVRNTLAKLRQNIRDHEAECASGMNPEEAPEGATFQFYYSEDASGNERLALTDAQFWGEEGADGEGAEAGWPKPGFYFVEAKSGSGRKAPTLFEWTGIHLADDFQPEKVDNTHIEHWQKAHGTMYDRLQTELLRVDRRAKEAEEREHAARREKQQAVDALSILKKENLALQITCGKLVNDLEVAVEEAEGVTGITSPINLREEATDGGWQAIADETAKRTRDVLLAQLKNAKVGSLLLGAARTFLKSEFGLGAWSLGFGILLPHLPKAKDSTHIQRVALEMRVGGFRHGFLGMADHLVDTVMSVVEVVGVTENMTKELGMGVPNYQPESVKQEQAVCREQ